MYTWRCAVSSTHSRFDLTNHSGAAANAAAQLHRGARLNPRSDMTYYADFSLYDLIEYEKPEGFTIGWLEDGYDYPVDEVSEEDLANIIDLGSLRQHRSRGWHSCTLCGEYTEHRATSERAGITYRLGHAEIRAVSDDGVLYVAPNLIIHYIVDHLYGPPAEFIDAVRSEVRRRWPVDK